jgi:plasmid stabilization system protein ParE
MFALTWSNDALDLLADIYVAATPAERARIAAGVEALNARLRSDPINEGESRPNGRRLTFAPLLAVVFRVSTANRIVRVTHVHRYGK